MTSLVDLGPSDGAVLESVIEGCIDCTVVLDLDGRLRFMNRIGQSLMEVDDFATLQGLAWTALWPPEHQRQVDDAVALALSGGPTRFKASRPTLAGTPKSWDILVSPLRNGAGALAGAIGQARDITEDEAAIHQARNSHEFMRGVMDGMAASICVLDENGVIISSNTAWQAFRRENDRVAPGDGVGQDFRQAARAAVGRVGIQLSKSLDEIYEGRCDAFEAEYPFHTPSRKRWVRLNAYRVPSEGRMRVVVMHQPITDLKLGEQRLRRTNSVLRSATRAAKAASEAKSAFLATMSHEIRTPLNGVLGMAQAMANEDLPETQRQRLDVIRHSGETLLLLLNDVLDLSKVEAGKLDLEDSLVDAEEIAHGVRAAFSSLAAAKDLYFGVDVTPEARGVWRGDPVRVRQVLYNLVSNAVKFTERGAIQVEISHDGRQLIMRVADTGPGLPIALRIKLFTKFVQADASTTRRYGGSGLGLAICRELIDLMDGQVTVDSIVDQGSTFCVRLPLPRAVAPAATESAVQLVQASHANLRVLAAEDNPMNVMVLKTLLGQVGIEPHVVNDGGQAVRAWEAADWDLILMDVQMPVMDGPAAARMIRAEERARRRARTPIIALTANAMSHHHAEYAAAGMDALCAKPIDLVQLLATMDSVLSLDDDAAQGQAACA